MHLSSCLLQGTFHFLLSSKHNILFPLISFLAGKSERPVPPPSKAVYGAKVALLLPGRLRRRVVVGVGVKVKAAASSPRTQDFLLPRPKMEVKRFFFVFSPP